MDRICMETDSDISDIHFPIFLPFPSLLLDYNGKKNRWGPLRARVMAERTTRRTLTCPLPRLKGLHAGADVSWLWGGDWGGAFLIRDGNGSGGVPGHPKPKPKLETQIRPELNSGGISSPKSRIPETQWLIRNPNSFTNKQQQYSSKEIEMQ